MAAKITRERAERIARASTGRPTAMVQMLARVVGIGAETADLLVQEILRRDLKDRRAVAGYAGLTGSPSESGARRRERGLSRSGNARVRRGRTLLTFRH